MAASLVMGAIGLALALGMGGKGISDQKKAKKIADSNPRPTYKIAPEELANQTLVESIAGRGLSEATKQYYTTNSERGLSSTIDAILKGGGDSNTVGQVYGQFNDAQSKLAVADDQQRFATLQMLLKQNQSMAEQRDKVFQINEYAPFADKAKEAAALSAQGQQEIISGINTGFSALGTYAQGANQRRDVNNMNYGYGNQRNSGTGNSGNGMSANWGETPASGDTMRLNNMAYNFGNLTPEQASLISGLFSNRLLTTNMNMGY